MNEKQKTTVLVIAFIGFFGLLVGGYYSLIMSKAKVKAHDSQLGKLSDQNRVAKEKLESLKAIIANKEQVEANRAKIAAITKRLPNSPDAPGFVNALVTVLRRTGIIQQSVRPSGSQNRTQYTEIPYSILAFGRYHEIGQFLTMIEQNKDRFMRVKSIKVSNNLKRPSIHPMNIQIATFMFNNPPPPPKPTPVPEKAEKKKKKTKEE